jgi:hypothetical protein
VIFLGAGPEWRNWQTRRTQNPVAARPCGFDPLLRDHKPSNFVHVFPQAFLILHELLVFPIFLAQAVWTDGLWARNGLQREVRLLLLTRQFLERFLKLVWRLLRAVESRPPSSFPSLG